MLESDVPALRHAEVTELEYLGAGWVLGSVAVLYLLAVLGVSLPVDCHPVMHFAVALRRIMFMVMVFMVA